MHWIFVILAAHLLYALVTVSDKFVVEKSLKHPLVYSFLTTTVSAGALFFLIANPTLLRGGEWFLAAGAGVSFLLGSSTYFTALNHGGVTRTPPLIGGATALWTITFGSLFFAHNYTSQIILPLFFLITGIFLIAFSLPRSKRDWHPLTPSFIIASGAFFALSTLMFERLTLQADFIPAFAFTRGFAAGAALLMLLSSRFRSQLLEERFRTRTKNERRAPFIKFFGALANVLEWVSITKIGATLTNSLTGLQYILLIPLSLLLARRAPTIYIPPSSSKERITLLCGVVVIVIGLGFLGVTKIE